MMVKIELSVAKQCFAVHGSRHKVITFRSMPVAFPGSLKGTKCRVQDSLTYRVLKIKDEIGLEFAVRGSGTVLYESIATRGNQKTKVFELSWRGLGFVPSSYPDRFVNSQPCPDRSGWYFCPEGSLWGIKAKVQEKVS